MDKCCCCGKSRLPLWKRFVEGFKEGLDFTTEFICFWDSSPNEERVNRRVDELIREEAIRRGECPCAFAKKLDGVKSC